MRSILLGMMMIGLLAACSKKQDEKKQPVPATPAPSALPAVLESIIGIYTGMAERHVQYGWDPAANKYDVVRDTTYPATLEIRANGPNEFSVTHRGHISIYMYDAARVQYTTGNPAKGGELLKHVIYGKTVEYKSDDVNGSYNEGEFYSFTGTKQ